MSGIKETKELVIGLATFASDVGKVMNGHVGFGDLAYLVDAAKSMVPALQGIDQVPDELFDLDGAELAELQSAFKDKFDIPQKEIEALVETALDAAETLLQLVLSLRKT